MTFEQLSKNMSSPRRVILGTDWGTDCDDCAALRLIGNAHKSGAVELAGIGINCRMEYSAASLSAFLCDMGLDGIPIGLDPVPADSSMHFRYQKLLAGYPHSVQRNEDCEDAVKLYRRLLAGSDKKTDIIEIGFENIISGLLQSGGDEFSPLGGIELVREKVGRLWLMAGKWDEDGGREYNICRSPRTAAAGSAVAALCPVPITYLGFEVGESVITGSHLDREDILFKAFEARGHANGRSSWDPMLTLLAIIGDAQTAGYSTACGTAAVDPETGSNRFLEGGGAHCYVIKTKPDEFYSDWIDGLL